MCDYKNTVLALEKSYKTSIFSNTMAFSMKNCSTISISELGRKLIISKVYGLSMKFIEIHEIVNKKQKLYSSVISPENRFFSNI